MIQLPRPIVNQILHHAQRTTEQAAGGMLVRTQQNTLVCHPVVAQSDAFVNTLQKMMTDNPDALFAIYCVQRQPEQWPQELLRAIAMQPVVYLAVELNTKGVLELTAYRKVNDGFEPIELELFS